MHTGLARNYLHFILFVVMLALALLATPTPRDAAASGNLAPKAPTAQTDIPGPTGSGNFGGTVTVLQNGNFVVVDTNFSEGGVNNIGAVYLYQDFRLGKPHDTMRL